MSVQPQPWPEPDPQIAAAVRAMYRGRREAPLAVQVRDRLGELFPDAGFAEAFGRAGRPGWSPGRLALVTVLQKAANLTDRQASDEVRENLVWKYALGLGLEDPGFDHTVLSEFRTRVVAHGLEERVLDLLLDKLRNFDLVKAGGSQRTDSTHIVAAVRDLNRLELVGESVRAALNALSAAAPRLGRPGTGRRRVGQPVRGARRHLAHPRLQGPQGRARTQLRQGRLHPADRAARAGIPAVAARNPRRADPAPDHGAAVHPHRGGQRQHPDPAPRAQRGRRRRPCARSDTPGLALRHRDTRWSAKRDLFWNGFKLHVSETCHPQSDGDRPARPNIITNVATTTSTLPDVSALKPVHQSLGRRRLLPERHYLDSGYPSAELIVDSAQTYGVALVTPVLLDTSRQAKAAQGFAAHDFTIDWDNQQATCPAGKTSTAWSPNIQDGVPKTVVTFAALDCIPCPSKEQCTSARKNRRQLSLYPRELTEAVHNARAQQQTGDWNRDYALRAGIEGTIRQATHTTGLRRARYRGLAKTHLDHTTSATALNLIRLNAWWNGRPLDRANHSHLGRLQLSLST